MSSTSRLQWSTIDASCSLVAIDLDYPTSTRQGRVWISQDPSNGVSTDAIGMCILTVNVDRQHSALTLRRVVFKYLMSAQLPLFGRCEHRYIAHEERWICARWSRTGHEAMPNEDIIRYAFRPQFNRAILVVDTQLHTHTHINAFVIDSESGGEVWHFQNSVPHLTCFVWGRQFTVGLIDGDKMISEFGNIFIFLICIKHILFL